MYKIKFPRIYDHHSHLSLHLLFACCPDFSDCRNTEEVRLKCRELDRSSVNVGTGWTGLLDMADKAFDDLPPLAVINSSWHGFACNEKAAALLGANGVIVEPKTAREKEMALPGLLRFFSRRCSPQSLRHDILKSETAKLLASWHKKGIYGAEDLMCVLPEEAVALWPAAFRRSLFFSAEAANGGEGDRKLPPPKLKLFADGALSARTAAVSEGYLQGEKGILIYGDRELTQIFSVCMKNRRPAAVHAIGDAAIEQVLSCYERAACSASAETPFPLRLEHCQFIDEEQAFKAKKLHITLCMQPNFSADSLTYADRLGEAALKRNNPLRMLIDKAGFVPGEDLLFGSDGLDCGSATALQSALFPPFAGQRLSVEELKAGYRADPQYGFAELLVDPDKKSVIYA
ncbi:amidohydrolase family protein [bacterium]|nr:amidohydrolase family protein [bacterium]